MTESLKTPAERLTYARVRAGYGTAISFTEKHRIPQATYSLHESGKRGIRPPVAEKYASLLGNCTAAWILYGESGGPSRTEGVGIVAESDRQTEEMAAFMLLYDRISAAAKENEQAAAEEFGIVPRLYGFRADERGTVQMAFHIWQQIAQEQSDASLVERVLERVRFVEGGMRQVTETLRGVAEALGGRPPPKK